MSLAFAKAGSSDIAIGARSDMASLEQEIQTAASEAGKPQPKVLQLKLDVTSRESVDNAAMTVEKEFGKLDIVINNAGILGRNIPVADSDPDDWWNVWTMNVRGPYLITRAFLPLLLRGGDKTIINVSSVGAHLTTPGLSSYQTTKLALLRFTEFLCAEYLDKGLLAYCIHPGSVATDIVAEIPEELKRTGMSTLADMVLLHELIYKKVFVETPELSADTIVYLTQEKREWLAGRYVNCTWDMPQIMAMENDIVKGDKFKVRLVI